MGQPDCRCRSPLETAFEDWVYLGDFWAGPADPPCPACEQGMSHPPAIRSHEPSQRQRGEMALANKTDDWGWEVQPSPEEIEAARNESYLGTAAQLLLEEEFTRETALLLDVHHLTIKGHDRWKGDVELASAHLLVDPWVVRRFDDDARERVRWALDTVVRQIGYEVGWVEVFPEPAKAGWREQVQAALANPDATNQATLAPLPAGHPREDALNFRDSAERRVYHALKQRQEALPKTDTFSIIPNPGVRVQHRTVEPDFLVTYRGRCGAIEVDGASHARKWSSDRSREYSIEDAGIAFVRRIDVADAADDRELGAFIDAFLRKLASS